MLPVYRARDPQCQGGHAHINAPNRLLHRQSGHQAAMRAIQLTRAHQRSPRAGAFETPSTRNRAIFWPSTSTSLACSSASSSVVATLVNWVIDLSSDPLSTVGCLSAGGPRAAGVFLAEDCGEPGASVCPHPTD